MPRLAAQMLGGRLVTKQTPPEGVVVNHVTIGEALDIVRETYIAVLLDSNTASPIIVGSPCGGVDIEEVAASTPEKIYKEIIGNYQNREYSIILIKLAIS